MDKRFIRILIIFLVVFSFSFVKVKAINEVTINVTINNKTESLNVDSKDKLNIFYESGTKKLTVSNNSGFKREFSVLSDNDNVTFSTNKIATFAITGGYSFFNLDSVEASSVKFVLGPDDDFYVFQNNKEIYDDRYELNVIVLFESRAAMSGLDVLLADVEKHLTIEEIKVLIDLKATDDYDGDLTSKILVVKNEYELNKGKIGTFEIEFSVTNTAKLETKYTLKVMVKDFDAPVITGPDTLEYSYTKNIDTSDIIALYSVKDNYSNNLTLEVDSSNLNASVPGIYQLNLKATDENLNVGEKNVQVKIIDDVNPIFKDELDEEITINYRNNISDGVLLMGLEAIDEIDGVLTNKIKIIENNLIKKLGSYTVVYEVKDEANNKTTYVRTYKVISVNAPQFFVSKNLLTIEDVNSMTLDQLAAVLAELNEILIISYEVLINEYTGNENTSGNYHVSLLITDTNGLIHKIDNNIKVYNKSEIRPDIRNNNNKYYLLLTLVPFFIGGMLYIKKKK